MWSDLYTKYKTRNNDKKTEPHQPNTKTTTTTSNAKKDEYGNPWK